VTPRARDDRHHSSEQSNSNVALSIAYAFAVAIIVFGGFYLFAQWHQSRGTSVTTTPHQESVIP
jgi:hypothetical protein